MRDVCRVQQCGGDVWCCFTCGMEKQSAEAAAAAEGRLSAPWVVCAEHKGHRPLPGWGWGGHEYDLAARLEEASLQAESAARAIATGEELDTTALCASAMQLLLLASSAVQQQQQVLQICAQVLMSTAALLEGRKPNEKRPKCNRWWRRVVPKMTDEQFRLNFRMRKDVFKSLLVDLHPELKVAAGEGGVMPLQVWRCKESLCLAMAIWRLKSTESLDSMAERFGVSHGTASNHSWSGIQLLAKQIAP